MSFGDLAHLCSCFRLGRCTTIKCRGKKNIEEEASQHPSDRSSAGALGHLPCNGRQQAAEVAGLGLRSEMGWVPIAVHIEPRRVRILARAGTIEPTDFPLLSAMSGALL